MGTLSRTRTKRQRRKTRTRGGARKTRTRKTTVMNAIFGIERIFGMLKRQKDASTTRPTMSKGILKNQPSRSNIYYHL